MRYWLSLLVALCAVSVMPVNAARAQPARAGKPERPYRSFVFIEIDERHRDLAGEGPGESTGQRMVFPYTFDSRRGILRPTQEVQGEDFLQGKSIIIVLHRIVYEGQRRGGSYWVVHRFNDLPAEIDLPSVPEQQKLALSADEQNRFVRPVSLSWVKGKTPVLHVEYGNESIDLAGGQRWTSRPSWLPAVFADFKRPVHVSSELSVRFWGRIAYTSLSEEGEVELLLPLLAKGRSASQNSYFGLVSIGDAAVPGLVRMMESENPDVRQLALDCLGTLCAREAVPDIIRLLDSPKWVIASSAAHTLGALGDPRAVEPLLKLLKESKKDALVGEAASALGAIGDKRATPALKELLADANPKRKLAGASGLGLMGREDSLELARKVLQGDDREAVWHSLDVLWIIGGKEAHRALSDFARRHEGESVGEDALLFAKLVAARQGSARERRGVLGDVLAGKGIQGILAAYEIERLDTQEAVAIFREQIEKLGSQGDFESSARLRALLWRLMARKAWRDYDTKGEREGN